MKDCKYCWAVSALAAFTEFAFGYLHRKQVSLPRKLCAPHFAHAQSPCFHFSDASLSPFPFPFPAGDCAALPFGLFGTRTFFFFLATPSVATAVAASAGFCFALALFGVLGFLLFSLAMVLPHSARCRVLRGISGGGGYFLQSSEQTAGKWFRLQGRERTALYIV